MFRRKYLRLSEIQPKHRDFYNLTRQEIRIASNGQKLLHVIAICPICGAEHWQDASRVRRGKTGPYCRRHLRTRLLQPEEIDVNWRPYFRFHNQEIRDNKNLFIQVICPGCGCIQWKVVSHIRKGRQTPFCQNCGLRQYWQEQAASHVLSRDGYVMLLISTLPPKDRELARQMTSQSRIGEHRLVMARYLGRPLKRRIEQVHHRNGKKGDNRIANLRLVTHQTHHIAPADAIAKLVTKIEHHARQLQQAQIDPIPYLRKQIRELEDLRPPELLITPSCNAIRTTN